MRCLKLQEKSEKKKKLRRNKTAFSHFCYFGSTTSASLTGILAHFGMYFLSSLTALSSAAFFGIGFYSQHDEKLLETELAVAYATKDPDKLNSITVGAYIEKHPEVVEEYIKERTAVLEMKLANMEQKE